MRRAIRRGVRAISPTRIAERRRRRRSAERAMLPTAEELGIMRGMRPPMPTPVEPENIYSEIPDTVAMQRHSQPESTYDTSAESLYAEAPLYEEPVSAYYNVELSSRRAPAARRDSGVYETIPDEPVYATVTPRALRQNRWYSNAPPLPPRRRVFSAVGATPQPRSVRRVLSLPGMRRGRYDVSSA